jgi:hypothetical protein
MLGEENDHRMRFRDAFVNEGNGVFAQVQVPSIDFRVVTGVAKVFGQLLGRIFVAACVRDKNMFETHGAGQAKHWRMNVKEQLNTRKGKGT